MPVFQTGEECSVPHSLENMVNSGSNVSHQRPVAQGKTFGSSTLNTPSARTLNQDAVKQCHSFGLYQPSRGLQESCSPEGSKPDNPAISAVHIPRVDIWKADYLSLDQEEPFIQTFLT